MYKYMYDNLKNKIRVRVAICRNKSRKENIEGENIIASRPLSPQKSYITTLTIPTIINSMPNILLITCILLAFTHKLPILTQINSFLLCGISTPVHRVTI